jgi:hypothetical protein
MGTVVAICIRENTECGVIGKYCLPRVLGAEVFPRRVLGAGADSHKSNCTLIFAEWASGNLYGSVEMHLQLIHLSKNTLRNIGTIEIDQKT